MWGGVDEAISFSADSALSDLQLNLCIRMLAYASLNVCVCVCVCVCVHCVIVYMNILFTHTHLSLHIYFLLCASLTL